MKKLLARLFGLQLDYRIVGDYYESDGHGHYHKKYIKKYYLKRGKS